MRTISVVMPVTKVSSVRAYMKSRELSMQEMYTDVDSFVSGIADLEGDDNFLYIFDFVNESIIYDTVVSNIDKFKEITVITTIKSVANMYRDVATKVRLVAIMADILSLFWDSPVFSLDNIERLERANIPVIEQKTGSFKGNLNKLTITLEVEVNKDKSGCLKVSYKGKEGNKLESVRKREESSKKLLSYVASSANNLVDALTGIEEVDTEKDKASSLELIKQIRSTKLYTSFPEFLRDGHISEQMYNQLIVQGLKTLCQQIDYCVMNGWFNESAGLERYKEFTKEPLLTRQEVMDSPINMNKLKYENCKLLNAFCRSVDGDRVYIVIDPDNSNAKGFISSNFNSYQYVYSRDTYIKAKLDAIENTQNAIGERGV